MHDPLTMGHHPSEEEIQDLVNDMIDRTSAYLPEGWNR